MSTKISRKARAELMEKIIPGADLSGANLTEADLSGANLTEADLSRANLTRANFYGANFYGANLAEAGLSKTNLSRANLTRANFYGANFYGANLAEANLDKANLDEVNLAWANLTGANLEGAILYKANLSFANLTGVTGLLSPWDWLTKNFVQTSEGFIVYKRVGITSYESPDYWELKSGAIWREQVNPDRSTDCGSGVNFGTLKWCLAFCIEAPIYKMLLPWEGVASLVVPYNTDGKARTGCLVFTGEVVAED